MKQILFCTIMSAGLLTCNINATEIDRGLINMNSGMTDSEQKCLITIINRLKSGDARTDGLGKIETFKEQSCLKKVITEDVYDHVLARGLTPLAVTGLESLHDHVPDDVKSAVESGLKYWKDMLHGPKANVKTFLSSCRDVRLLGDFVQFIAEMGGIVDTFHEALILSKCSAEEENAAKQFEQDVHDRGNEFTSYLHRKAADPQCIDQEARDKFYHMAVALKELWIHGYRGYFSQSGYFTPLLTINGCDYEKIRDGVFKKVGNTISATEIDSDLIKANSGMTDSEQKCLITIINRLKSGDARTDDLEIEVFKKQSNEKEVKTGKDAYNYVLERGVTPLAVTGLKYLHDHVPNAVKSVFVESGYRDLEEMLRGVETFLSSCSDVKLLGDFVQFIAEMGGIVDTFHNKLILSTCSADREVAAKQFTQKVYDRGNEFASYLNKKAYRCIDLNAVAKFFYMAVALRELWLQGYRDYFSQSGYFTPFYTRKSAGLSTCNISATEIDSNLIKANSGITDSEQECLITIINRLKSGDVSTDGLGKIETFKEKVITEDVYDHVLARGLTPLAVTGLESLHEHVPNNVKGVVVELGLEYWKNTLHGQKANVKTFLSSCRDVKLLGEFVQFIAEMGGIVDTFHEALILSKFSAEEENAAEQFKQGVRDRGTTFIGYLHRKAADPQCIDQEAVAKFYSMAVALKELWIHGYRGYFGRAGYFTPSLTINGCDYEKIRDGVFKKEGWRVFEKVGSL